MHALFLRAALAVAAATAFAACAPRKPVTAPSPASDPRNTLKAGLFDAAEYTSNLHFADPVLQLGSPKLLTSLDALGLYASGMHYVAEWVPRRLLSGPLLEQWARYVLGRAVRHATVVVAPVVGSVAQEVWVQELPVLLVVMVKV